MEVAPLQGLEGRPQAGNSGRVPSITLTWGRLTKFPNFVFFYFRIRKHACEICEMLYHAKHFPLYGTIHVSLCSFYINSYGWYTLLCSPVSWVSPMQRKHNGQSFLVLLLLYWVSLYLHDDPSSAQFWKKNYGQESWPCACHTAGSVWFLCS